MKKMLIVLLALGIVVAASGCTTVPTINDVGKTDQVKIDQVKQCAITAKNDFQNYINSYGTTANVIDIRGIYTDIYMVNTCIAYVSGYVVAADNGNYIYNYYPNNINPVMHYRILDMNKCIMVKEFELNTCDVANGYGTINKIEI